MDFTDTQQEILANAWALSQEGRGRGQVLADWAEADAQQLCDAGWLERRPVNDSDEVAYFWTREAETALDLNALNKSVEDRQN